MILRALTVVALVAIVFSIAKYRPAPIPHQPEDTHLVKIDAKGNTLPVWQGPWSCVLDTQSELLWEVKSDNEDIHDGNCSFSWFDGDIGEAKQGDCFVGDLESDTFDLINISNEEMLCGTNRWRLPTEAELSTLLIDKPYPGEPLLARDFFPYGQRGLYWTNAHGQTLPKPFEHLKEGAVALSFIDRTSKTTPYQHTPYARLVSTWEPVEQN